MGNLGKLPFYGDICSPINVTLVISLLTYWCHELRCNNNVIEQLIAWSGMDLKMAKTFMSLSPHFTILPSDSDIEDAFSSMNILNYFLASSGNIFPKSSKKFSSPKDTETPVESPIPISSSVGSSSPVRSTTSPPGYSINELSNSVKISLWIIP
ncbi:hypothetical protein Tco_1289020 [Tanacetum coccineum]